MFIRVTVLRIPYDHTSITPGTRSPQRHDATRGAALAEVPTEYSQHGHHSTRDTAHATTFSRITRSGGRHSHSAAHRRYDEEN